MSCQVFRMTKIWDTHKAIPTMLANTCLELCFLRAFASLIISIRLTHSSLTRPGSVGELQSAPPKLPTGLLFFNNYQRAPKRPPNEGPPNEDPPTSRLRASVCSFSFLAPWSSCLAVSDRRQKHGFSISVSSSLLKWLLLIVASVVKSPTMIRVLLLCARVLRGRARWRLLKLIR